MLSMAMEDTSAAETTADAKEARATDHMSVRNPRIEVMMRSERRRRWSVEQKREIAAQNLEPGLSSITVARRYGISGGLLARGADSCWRERLAPPPNRWRSSRVLR
jgi:transposase-like protein